MLNRFSHGLLDPLLGPGLFAKREASIRGLSWLALGSPVGAFSRYRPLPWSK